MIMICGAGRKSAKVPARVSNSAASQGRRSLPFKPRLQAQLQPMTVEPTRAATPTWQAEAQLLMNVNCEALKHKQSNSAQTRRDGGSVRRRCPSFPLCQGGATDPWGPRVCVACNQTYNRDVVWWDEGLGHMCYGPGATNTQSTAECPTTAYTPRASAAHAGAGGRQSQYAVCR